MTRWRRYLLFHGEMLLLAVAFWGYTKLTDWIFPNGFLHCFLHDILHLYCPFCGGTRAFLALLRLDIGEALRANSAVLIAAAAVLALDLRAFVMLCRKKEGRLIPSALWRLSAAYFLLYALARNTALLFGFDRLGDLTAFWQGRITLGRAAWFLPLALLMCGAFWLAVDSVREARFRLSCAFTGGALLIALLCVLYARWFFTLLYLPLCVGFAVWLVYCRSEKKSIRKKESA